MLNGHNSIYSGTCAAQIDTDKHLSSYFVHCFILGGFSAVDLAQDSSKMYLNYCDADCVCWDSDVKFLKCLEIRS